MKNPDQGLLRRFAEDGGAPVRIDSSPFLVALGAELHKINRETGLIELRFTPGEQFLQGAGVLQGGAVTSMLDFAMGFSGLARVPHGQTIATANLNVAFLRAARMGTYSAVAEIERLGRSLVFTRSQLFIPGEPPVATATSTLLVLSS